MDRLQRLENLRAAVDTTHATLDLQYQDLSRKGTQVGHLVGQFDDMLLKLSALSDQLLAVKNDINRAIMNYKELERQDE